MKKTSQPHLDIRTMFPALIANTGLGFRADENLIRFAHPRVTGEPFQVRVIFESGEIRLESENLIGLPKSKLEHFRQAVAGRLLLDSEGDYFRLRANVEATEPGDQIQADLRAALISMREAIDLLPEDTKSVDSLPGNRIKRPRKPIKRPPTRRRNP
jgi:hypothetical protein